MYVVDLLRGLFWHGPDLVQAVFTDYLHFASRHRAYCRDQVEAHILVERLHDAKLGQDVDLATWT
eukprot:9750631-Lingulodinium_polyedra.AAC.1